MSGGHALAEIPGPGGLHSVLEAVRSEACVERHRACALRESAASYPVRPHALRAERQVPSEGEGVSPREIRMREIHTSGLTQGKRHVAMA